MAKLKASSTLSSKKLANIAQTVLACDIFTTPRAWAVLLTRDFNSHFLMKEQSVAPPQEPQSYCLLFDPNNP